MGTIGVRVAVRKELNFKMFIKSIDESLRTAAIVLLLIYGSSVLGNLGCVSG
jgi:TRAP-type C4-dicarboxylate transport system permease large subunit